MAELERPINTKKKKPFFGEKKMRVRDLEKCVLHKITRMFVKIDVLSLRT